MKISRKLKKFLILIFVLIGCSSSSRLSLCWPGNENNSEWCDFSIRASSRTMYTVQCTQFFRQAHFCKESGFRRAIFHERTSRRARTYLDGPLGYTEYWVKLSKRLFGEHTWKFANNVKLSTTSNCQIFKCQITNCQNVKLSTMSN